jgi:Zn-dependent peptidase ImmA (M78 family)/DNA-binding XRE family transcriptional regulator
MSEMPQERIGRRIKWIREQQGLTQEELTKRLGFKDRQTIATIEAGKRKTSPDELVAITSALSVELDELVDPFRLVGEGGFNFRARDVEPATVTQFEQLAGRWIATYRELGRQSGIEPGRFGQKLELTHDSSLDDAAASAEALRRRWALGDVPAETLEHAIERELGTLVLYVDAPAGISGAASQLPGLQTILVNRNEPASRRAFDLAHELFHVLTWDAMPPSRIEDWEATETKGNRVERLANKFAACLLMPDLVVRERWTQRGDVELEEWVGSTSRSLRVSPLALQWQLVNLGLLPKVQMVNVPGDAPDPFSPKPSLFSAAFVSRVQQAVEAGRLSFRRAAGLLGLSLSDFADVCRSYGRPLSYDS